MTAVIVIEPASSGTALVAAAARLGAAAHVFSADRDERFVPRDLRAAVTSFTVVDTASSSAVAAAACAIGADGIVPGFEYSVDVAAEAAAPLGLPHLPLEALTRDKYRSRSRLAAAGLGGPDSPESQIAVTS